MGITSLCNSENGDIAWWNKNNSDWDFSLKKERNIVSFLKTPGFSKKTGGLGLKKTAVSQPCV